jgi:hypothetical protein
MPPLEGQTGCLSAAEVPPSAPSAAARVAVEHCRVWLNWAAAQVDACLARDNLASGELLAALAELLGPAPPLSGSAPAPAGGAANEKMAAVIIAVQSHDRVMQGLAHAAESLRALHALLGDAGRADSAEAWRGLRETQLRAFSMAQERALFTSMVAPEGESAREADLDPQETVELFVADHGLLEP